MDQDKLDEQRRILLEEKKRILQIMQNKPTPIERNSFSNNLDSSKLQYPNYKVPQKGKSLRVTSDFRYAYNQTNINKK